MARDEADDLTGGSFIEKIQVKTLQAMILPNWSSN